MVMGKVLEIGGFVDRTFSSVSGQMSGTPLYEGAFTEMQPSSNAATVCRVTVGGDFDPRPSSQEKGSILSHESPPEPDDRECEAGP